MNIPAAALLGFTSLTGFCHTVRIGFDAEPPQVDKFEFAPVDGSWDITAHDRDSHSLPWNHVEFYQVTLEAPATQDQSRALQIMADGDKVGIMKIEITAGQTSPTFKYEPDEGALVTPSGASTLTNGQFWLACTAPSKRVRGNAGKTADGDALVQVRLAWAHSVQTAAHRIKCVP